MITLFDKVDGLNEIYNTILLLDEDEWPILTIVPNLIIQNEKSIFFHCIGLFM